VLITLFCILCIFINKFLYTEEDGDLSVEFYWIDPMLSAERIALNQRILDTCTMNMSLNVRGKDQGFAHLGV
jgi:hypothetical protein